MVWLKEKLGVWSILTSRNEMKVVMMVKMIINKWAALKTCSASFMVPTSCKHQMLAALTARTAIWNFRWALNPTMRPPEPFTFSFNLLFHQNEKIPSISPSFDKGTIEEKQACSTSRSLTACVRQILGPGVSAGLTPYSGVGFRNTPKMCHMRLRIMLIAYACPPRNTSTLRQPHPFLDETLPCFVRCIIRRK